MFVYLGSDFDSLQRGHVSALPHSPPSFFCLFRCSLWGTIEQRQDLCPSAIFLSFVVSALPLLRLAHKWEEYEIYSLAEMHKTAQSSCSVWMYKAGSCAFVHGDNSTGQLREQECARLIMWTGYCCSLVIGSQASSRPSHEVSPHRSTKRLFMFNNHPEEEAGAQSTFWILSPREWFIPYAVT